MKKVQLGILVFLLLCTVVPADGIHIDYVTLSEAGCSFSSEVYRIKVLKMNQDKQIIKGEIVSIIHSDNQSFKTGSIKDFPVAYPEGEEGEWVLYEKYWEAEDFQNITIGDIFLTFNGHGPSKWDLLSDTAENRRKILFFTLPDGEAVYKEKTDDHQLAVDLRDQDLFLWAYRALSVRNKLTEEIIISAFFENNALASLRNCGQLKETIITYHLSNLGIPEEKKDFLKKVLNKLPDYYSYDSAYYIFSIISSTPEEYGLLMAPFFDLTVQYSGDGDFVNYIYYYVINYARRGWISEETLYDLSLKYALSPTGEECRYDKRTRLELFLDSSAEEVQYRFLTEWESAAGGGDLIFKEITEQRKTRY